jgi:Uma2 family endonuclease
MSAIATTPYNASFVLPMQAEELTPAYLLDVSAQNPGWTVERSANHQLLLMPPTNSETGNRNFRLSTKLGIWNETHHLGHGFDSSTGFTLPNGAIYAPDVAWISRERWAALLDAERQTFAPIAPDFVLELRSPEQPMTGLKAKMSEYVDNGVRLAWLVDPGSQRTFVFEANGDIHTVPFEQALSGGEVLPGFVVVMAEVFGG